jgi:hypothetical protein
MQDEQGMFQAFGKLYRVQPLSSHSAHPELSHDTNAKEQD